MEKEVFMSLVNWDQRKYYSMPFEGQLVSINCENLVMTSSKGKYFSLTLAKDAEFTRNGIICAAEDLVPGNTIRVTKQQDERSVVICVDSIDEQSEYAECNYCC
jgi:hypothetical protein